ncbi:MAG: PHP domain-containing protein [Nitrosopumilus sp. B06]|nr:MAG: PHP domain-containing protein [Nitrosopumilus sp. B06]
MLRAELHCHNTFSNHRFGSKEPPYDCSVSIPEQLLGAQDARLDAIFVTNHNTLDGYKQILEYQDCHEKFAKMSIYPAEEATTDSGAHVLTYGIRESIPTGLEIDEITDLVHSQGGVVSAPHPFSIIDALREDAIKCDMIEVFNSNNVDLLSNAKAAEFAINNNMIQVSGSDSHVASTVGRCINVIDSENTLDDVLSAMKQGRIEISQTGYAGRDEIIENLRYKINVSREYMAEYVAENYAHTRWLFDLLLRLYDADCRSPLWSLTYRVALYFLKRISYQINYKGANMGSLGRRDLGTMIRLALR